MGCACHFAILPDKTPGTLKRLFDKACGHRPGDPELLAVGWEFSNLLGYATIGNEFSTPDGRNHRGSARVGEGSARRRALSA